MDKLNLITIFLKVAECGSFSGAAVELGYDPSTISKAIQKLEAHLNCALFIRTTRSIQLSLNGERYRDECQAILASLSACEQTIANHQDHAKGLLRVNLPVAYGQLYIMPLMSQFRMRHPEIELDISLSDEHIDIASQSIDIAIRSGHLKDSRLVARKLSPMDFATCASPRFITEHQIDMENLEHTDLAELPWIGYRFIHSGKVMPLYELTGDTPQKKTKKIQPSIALTTTDGASMLRACIDGMGIMQGPHFLLRDAVRNGQLKLLTSYYRSESFSIYAYYVNHTYLPLKVRVFIDFLKEELAQQGETTTSTFLSSLYDQ